MTKRHMGCSCFFMGHVKFCIAAMMLIGLTVIAKNTQAAWYEDHQGKDLIVHYVHLTGYGGDNDVNRQNLLLDYQGCVDVHKAFGNLYNPLPSSGIPPIVEAFDMEIYYSSNRVLIVSHSTANLIDFDACALVSHSKRKLELNSVIGSCKIDLNTQKAIGACDEKAQERAPDSTLAKIAPAKIPPIDLNKLPPHMRAKVAAQIDQFNKLPGGPAGRGALLPAGHKTIKNYPCTIYRANALKTEVCIAHPKSSFPIPASLMNGGIPGLLLEVHSPALTLQAQEVKMEMPVAKSIFAIPSGIKVTIVRVPREE